MDAEAERELAGFVGRFAPEMQDQIRGSRARLAVRYPRAVQLVYDNDNFLVVGFGPTQRPSEALFSLAAYRRGVDLCFLQRAPELPDPTSILRGTGSTLRNVASRCRRTSTGPTSSRCSTLRKRWRSCRWSSPRGRCW